MTEKELFYNGIFSSAPRKFGTLCEHIVEAKFNMFKSDKSNYDRLDKDRNRIEIKFSRCSKTKKKSNNIIDEIVNENLVDKYISSTDISCKYWCNIQQIKPTEFDILYYGIFFTDKILIFKTSSKEINKIPCYCDKQHRGNIGEGQFPINENTISWHKNNNFVCEMNYDEIYSILKTWK